MNSDLIKEESLKEFERHLFQLGWRRYGDNIHLYRCPTCLKFKGKITSQEI